MSLVNVTELLTIFLTAKKMPYYRVPELFEIYIYIYKFILSIINYYLYYILIYWLIYINYIYIYIIFGVRNSLSFLSTESANICSSRFMGYSNPQSRFLFSWWIIFSFRETKHVFPLLVLTIVICLIPEISLNSSYP